MSVVRRLLLVDDEADLRNTLAEQLKLHDAFETDTAGDGAEALEMAKTVAMTQSCWMSVCLTWMAGKCVRRFDAMALLALSSC